MIFFSEPIDPVQPFRFPDAEWMPLAYLVWSVAAGMTFAWVALLIVIAWHLVAVL